MNIVEEEFLWPMPDPPDGVKEIVFGAVKRAREEWDAADDDQKAAILQGRVFSAKMFNEVVDSESESLRQAALQVWESGLSSAEAHREWFTYAINTMVEREKQRVTLQHELNRAPVALMLNAEWFPVPSPEHYRNLHLSIARPQMFKPDDDGMPRADIFGKNGARTGITFRPEDMARNLPAAEIDLWASRMWQKQGGLCPLDGDVLDIVSSLCMKRAKSLSDSVVFDIDDILAMRGLEKREHGNGRRGGYTEEQRAQVRESLLDKLAHMWVRWEESPESNKRGKAGRPRIGESPAIIITARTGQQRLDGGMDVDTVAVQLGPVFAAYLQTDAKQYALLAHKALQYNWRTQVPEKMLTRFLTWQWRVRAREGNYEQPFFVQELLDQAGIKPSKKNPERTKNRLRDALAQLKTDGIIKDWDWDRNPERWSESVHGAQRGWLNIWLNATVEITPPDIIREQYKTLRLRPSQEPEVKQEPKPDPKAETWTTIIARMVAARKAWRISQSHMADILGVTQAQVSNMERGRAKPGAALQARIEEWLKSLDSTA